jgi:hypothetical protein
MVASTSLNTSEAEMADQGLIVPGYLGQGSSRSQSSDEAIIAKLPQVGSVRKTEVSELPPVNRTQQGSAPVTSREQAAASTLAAPASASAAAPGPTREDYENMPWSEVGSRALSNAPSSAMKAIKGVGEAIYNYEDTASALNQLGKGVYSKAKGALGFERNPEAEAMADAVGQMYADRYGSMAGFKQAVAEDPASIGMDVASIAPVVGVAGKAAGLGKLATGAANVAALGDPINLAMQTAKLGTKAITRPAALVSRVGQGMASGVPQGVLKIAEEAGRAGSPAQRNAFKTFATGRGDHRDIAKTAMDAVEELRAATSADYVARRSALTTQELPMAKIKKAVADVEANLGPNAGALFPEISNALQEMKTRIDVVENSSNPADRSAAGLDLLKKSLADISEGMRNSGHYGSMSSVPRAVRDTISSFDSGYADMMDRWQKWRNELLDFQRTLGTADKTAESARLAKLLSSAKNENKMSLLKELASKTETGKLLPYMIAGATVENVLPPALQAFGLAGLGSVALGGLHGISAAAIASPRLAGMTQYGLGRMEGAVNAIPKPPAVATNVLSQIGQEREGRKSGGRVSKHEADADQLVRAAERAKKGWSAKTEPLLNQSDEAVAKALEVANRSI